MLRLLRSSASRQFIASLPAKRGLVHPSQYVEANTQAVINLFGRNRPGLVSEASEVVHNQLGSVEESRMSRVGEFFTITMVADLDYDNMEPLMAIDDLRTALKTKLGNELEINVQSTKRWEPPSMGELATVSVMGSDAPGIVKEVTAAIAHPGLDILSADSEVHPAPFSGEMMFGLQLIVAVPSGLSIEEAEVLVTKRLDEVEEKFEQLDINFDLLNEEDGHGN